MCLETTACFVVTADRGGVNKQMKGVCECEQGGGQSQPSFRQVKSSQFESALFAFIVQKRDVNT